MSQNKKHVQRNIFNTCHIYTKITTNYVHSNTNWESQSMIFTRCNEDLLKCTESLMNKVERSGDRRETAPKDDFRDPSCGIAHN